MLKLINVQLFMMAQLLMMIRGQGVSSVQFFKSKQFNFFMAKGFIINDTYTDHLLTRNMNSCACKSACMAVDCAAWSITKLGNGEAECRLNKKGPYHEPPQDDNQHDSTYFYRQDKIPGTYFSMGDGLMYLKLTKPMNYDSAARRCKNHPGHRLMIIKTLAQWAALELLTEPDTNYFMDVRKILENGSPTVVFGDGTRLADTELRDEEVYNSVKASLTEDAYAYRHTYFTDVSRTNHTGFAVCQANTIGVEWLG